jgi:hypothetical protein
MAAAGKSQARFMAGLLGFLALLWAWHFMKPAGAYDPNLWGQFEA